MSLEYAGQVWLFGCLFGMNEVVSLAFHTVPMKLIHPGYAPDVRFNFPVLLEHLRCGNHFPEYGARTHQLDFRTFPPAGFL
jgi:hypothetical protein